MLQPFFPYHTTPVALFLVFRVGYMVSSIDLPFMSEFAHTSFPVSLRAKTES